MVRGAGAAGLLALVSVAIAGCGGEGSCVYGSNDQRSGSASVSCKPRPAPSGAETAALRSGAGLRAALRAYSAGDGAGEELIGIGVNAHAETTFTRRAESFVTYDRQGEEGPSDNANQREYAVATTGSAAVRTSEVKPAVLARALRRVHRTAPRGKFLGAVYASVGIAPRVGWRLTYSGMGTAGQLLIVDDRLCVLAPGATRSPLRGIEACDVRALLLGGAGGSTSTAPPTAAPARPSSPALSKAQEQLQCVQAAKGDVTKLAQCANP